MLAASTVPWRRDRCRATSPTGSSAAPVIEIMLQLLRLRSRGAIRTIVGALALSACSSPTDAADGTCITIPWGEGIRLTVVSATTGESLRDQALVHVLSVDPPRQEVVGRLDVVGPQNPLRAADAPGVYELLVEVPGHAPGFARVTVSAANGNCPPVATQEVTIRMTPR
jgi:hypothetical protein